MKKLNPKQLLSQEHLLLSPSYPSKLCFSSTTFQFYSISFYWQMQEIVHMSKVLSLNKNDNLKEESNNVTKNVIDVQCWMTLRWICFRSHCQMWYKHGVMMFVSVNLIERSNNEIAEFQYNVQYRMNLWCIRFRSRRPVWCKHRAVMFVSCNVKFSALYISCMIQSGHEHDG